MTGRAAGHAGDAGISAFSSIFTRGDPLHLSFPPFSFHSGSGSWYRRNSIATRFGRHHLDAGLFSGLRRA